MRLTRLLLTAATAGSLVILALVANAAAHRVATRPAPRNQQSAPIPTLPTPPSTPSTPTPTTPTTRDPKAQSDPSLRLHLAFGKGKVRGNQATDALGATSFTIHGKPEELVIGPGRGYQFRGATDWLELADDVAHAPFLPAADFSASAWVNLAATTEYGGILGAIQDNGDAESGWCLGYTHDAFTFALATKGADDGDGKLTYLKAKTTLIPGRWYFVAATYDGKTMRLFVNGQLDAESAQQNGPILYPAKGPVAACAYKDDNEFFPMQGTFFEIKLHHRALSSQEIADEHAAGARLSSYQPPVDTSQRFLAKPYLQWATTDGITIMWETALPGRGFVEFGESLPYSSKTPLGSLGTMHEIRISGLKLHTPYFYRTTTIADDGSSLVSDPLTFQTNVAPEAPFAFAIIGDTQRNKPVIEKLQAFSYSLRPNFQIHLGDVVDTGPDKNEWIDELLPASWPLMSRVCLFPSIGNHEKDHSHYYQYFSLPDPECWYTYTYGNGQFFVLDSNKPVDPDSPQGLWLQDQLAKSSATWKFVYHHHPVYSSDENDYGDTYKEKSTFGAPRHRALAPIYERHNVDIVFNGHIHSYERTWPIRGGKVDPSGVRYIIAGGGGGGLESSGPSRAWFTQRVYRGHHVAHVMIHGKSLHLQAFDLEGRLFDTMDLHKP